MCISSTVLKRLIRNPCVFLQQINPSYSRRELTNAKYKSLKKGDITNNFLSGTEFQIVILTTILNYILFLSLTH